MPLAAVASWQTSRPVPVACRGGRLAALPFLSSPVAWLEVPFRDLRHPVLQEIGSQAISNPFLAAAGVSEPELVSRDVPGQPPPVAL